jgi:tRNA nucleotidyltransferase (CCA-adding enzyme)
MSDQKINSILKKVAENSSPTKENVEIIKDSLQTFLDKLRKNLKKQKINAEVFLGGSYAKDTMIRKNNYDIDIFIRFEDGKNISSLTKKILKEFNAKTIHGSRDYFQITITQDIFFEIIPVKKVKKPKDAENITDLSYSHVKYIKKRVRTKKFLDEIRLAKVFCYANKCYGAESYINGFSGYALELLVYYYGSFIKFIKAMAKAKEKIIIDIEKDYKSKSQVMMDVNTSKLGSPIILIDPTYKQRNAAAALSEGTFKKFQTECKDFLKHPSVKAFEYKEIDFEKLVKDTKKKGDFVLLEVQTNRQAGDIAGSKLLKFYNHLDNEIRKFFDIKKQEFDYLGSTSAKYFFAGQNKGEISIAGPSITDRKNVARFKKKHKKTFVKVRRVFAKEKIDLILGQFVKKWEIKNKKRMKEMGIVELKIIN